MKIENFTTVYSKKFRFPLSRENFKSEKSFSAPGFFLKTKSNKEDNNRFAVIISSRAVKKSNRRHFWKRVIADALKELPNMRKDFLAIVSKNIEDHTKNSVREEIKKAARQIFNFQ